MAPDALPEAQPEREREGTRRGDQANGGARLADGDDTQSYHFSCRGFSQRPREDIAILRESYVVLAVWMLRL